VIPVKGDFSRQTFARKNHYSGVLLQQGRVQLDADWNEQQDIAAHRVETEAHDLIGGCGGPLEGAGFRVLPPAGSWRPDFKGRVAQPERGKEKGEGVPGLPNPTGVRPPDPAGARGVDPTGVRIDPTGVPPWPLPSGDFELGAGRYYVDGILCENERDVFYSQQPDFREPPLLGRPPLEAPGDYLLYLDVWRRHLTALDDPNIRETALGGPDTATRVKTVWQAKLWKVEGAAGAGECPDVFAAFLRSGAGRRNAGLLNASGAPEDASADPCVVSPAAGYRGLENLLYRVEIHAGGPAADVGSAADSVRVTALGQPGRDQLAVEAGLALNAGDAVELYPARAGSDPMAGVLYFVTGVGVGGALTLDRDVRGVEMAQEPRLRRVTATFKWSRQNGVVVTGVEAIVAADRQLTVQTLGPDDDLGFSEGDWVELSDDLTEQRGQPGQLTRIVSVDAASRAVVLRDAPALAGLTRHPKMRRWDGVVPVRTNPSDPERNWVTLESGVRVQFLAAGADPSAPGFYSTGDYWLIPARTATADRESGRVEWPADAAGRPEPQPPAGVTHHYCPLALLNWHARWGLTVVRDCRRLFPAVTELTTLHYVSGAGQEATPVLAPPQARVELPHPLVVGVSNGTAPVEGARVVFEVVEGEINTASPPPEGESPNGRLSPVSGGVASPPAGTKIEVRTDERGLARCRWELAPTRWNQQVTARLLGPDGVTYIHLPVCFNANLSVADKVAYKPGRCDKLAGFRTVQEALDELCRLVGLANEPGVRVREITFGLVALRELEEARRLREVGTRAGGSAESVPAALAAALARGELINNDFDLSCDALAEGLRVVCDQEVSALSVTAKPVCFVTLELPFPSDVAQREAWGLKGGGGAFVGYQPVVLDGVPESNGALIKWRPTEAAGTWLRGSVAAALGDPHGVAGRGTSARPGRVLARLTLKGNFVWALKDPSLHLDGDLFGVATKESGDATLARAPSGDGRRGGDLELWFWLVDFSLATEVEAFEAGEEVEAVVTLTGPARRPGAVVTFSVSDSAVATLARQSVNIAAGESRAAVGVRGVGPGRVAVRAHYAGGVREVALTVRLSVPKVEAVGVHRIQLPPRDEELARANPSTGLPPGRLLSVPQAKSPNAVEVKFTADAPVSFDSVNEASFAVRPKTSPPGAAVRGSFRPNPAANSVIWRAEKPLAAGDYSVTLSGDARGIISTRGRRLDGEPRQLPSGEGREGGAFEFTLRVVPAPAPPFKVTRLRVLSTGAQAGTRTPAAVHYDSNATPFTGVVKPDGGARVNAVEFEFSAPVKLDTVRDGLTLVVRRSVPNLPSTFETPAGDVLPISPTAIRWVLRTPPGAPLSLQKGVHTVTLHGDPNPLIAGNTERVTSDAGRPLDGEPSNIPSGDGRDGGAFSFALVIL
jgi:hypothetical protein